MIRFQEEQQLRFVRSFTATMPVPVQCFLMFKISPLCMLHSHILSDDFQVLREYLGTHSPICQLVFSTDHRCHPNLGTRWFGFLHPLYVLVKITATHNRKAWSSDCQSTKVLIQPHTTAQGIKILLCLLLYTLTAVIFLDSCISLALCTTVSCLHLLSRRICLVILLTPGRSANVTAAARHQSHIKVHKTPLPQTHHLEWLVPAKMSAQSDTHPCGSNPEFTLKITLSFFEQSQFPSPFWHLSISWYLWS